MVRRKKKRSLLTRYVFPLLEGVGRAVGVVTFLCALCLYGFGLVLTMDLTQHCRDLFLLTYSANWLLTNFVTYVVWDFCMYFNPLLCCAPSCLEEPGADGGVLAAPGSGRSGSGSGSGDVVQRDDKQRQSDPLRLHVSRGMSSNSSSNNSSHGGWKRRVLSVMSLLVGAAGQFLRWLGL